MKIFKKHNKDREVVSKSFYALSFTQKIMLILFMITTMATIDKVVAWIAKNTNIFAYLYGIYCSIKNKIFKKKKEEDDYSDDCPDKYDPFDID